MQLSTLINQAPIQCKTKIKTQKRGETTRFNVVRQNCLRPRAAVRSNNSLCEKKRIQWVPKPKTKELGSSSANISPLQSSQNPLQFVFSDFSDSYKLLRAPPFIAAAKESGSSPSAANRSPLFWGNQRSARTFVPLRFYLGCKAEHSRVRHCEGKLTAIERSSRLCLFPSLTSCI